MPGQSSYPRPYPCLLPRCSANHTRGPARAKDCRYHRRLSNRNQSCPRQRNARRGKTVRPVVPSQTTVPDCSFVAAVCGAHSHANPRVPAEPPPAAAAARLRGAPDLSFSCAAPKPTFQQRMKTVSAIEEALARTGSTKLGIIILVVGVALFGIYELGALGPLGKVGISYLASAFLLVGGIYLEKNERYRLLGRTGIGGGWRCFFSVPTRFIMSHQCVFSIP